MPESMHTRPTVTFAGLARAVLVDLQRSRPFPSRSVSSRPECTQMLGQPRVLRQLPVLAVDRHEISRPHQVQHQLHLLRRCRDRRRAAADSCVPYSTSAPRRAMWSIMRKMAFSLPGNDARAEHDRVALLDRDVLVIVHRHARQRRHRLALRAGNQDATLFGGASITSCGRSRMPSGIVQQPERVRDLGDRRPCCGR